MNSKCYWISLQIYAFHDKWNDGGKLKTIFHEKIKKGRNEWKKESQEKINDERQRVGDVIIQCYIFYFS